MAAHLFQTNTNGRSVHGNRVGKKSVLTPIITDTTTNVDDLAKRSVEGGSYVANSSINTDNNLPLFSINAIGNHYQTITNHTFF